jgi:hypothetical protein
VFLSPDVAEYFPDAASANEARRALVKTLRRIKRRRTTAAAGR